MEKNYGTTWVCSVTFRSFLQSFISIILTSCLLVSTALAQNQQSESIGNYPQIQTTAPTEDSSVELSTGIDAKVEVDTLVETSVDNVISDQNATSIVNKKTNVGYEQTLGVSTRKSASPTDNGGVVLVKVVLALIIVVLMIVVGGWVMRRFNLAGFHHQNTIKMQSILPLGSREKAVLLEVEGKKILLGVAPGRVNTLYTFDDYSSDGHQNESQSNLNQQFEHLMNDNQTDDKPSNQNQRDNGSSKTNTSAPAINDIRKNPTASLNITNHKPSKSFAQYISQIIKDGGLRYDKKRYDKQLND